jgi:hypothetical protein
LAKPIAVSKVPVSSSTVQSASSGRIWKARRLLDRAHRGELPDEDLVAERLDELVDELLRGDEVAAAVLQTVAAGSSDGIHGLIRCGLVPNDRGITAFTGIGSH